MGNEYAIAASASRDSVENFHVHGIGIILDDGYPSNLNSQCGSGTGQEEQKLGGAVARSGCILQREKRRERGCEMDAAVSSTYLVSLAKKARIERSDRNQFHVMHEERRRRWLRQIPTKMNNEREDGRQANVFRNKIKCFVVSGRVPYSV